MTTGLHLSNESLIQKNRIVTTPSDYYILTIFTHKKTAQAFSPFSLNGNSY